MASLKLELVNGKSESLPLADNANAREELRNFVQKVGSYTGEWITIAEDKIIARAAVVSVEISGDSGHRAAGFN